MIVCICHRISDRDIKRVVAQGMHSFQALKDCTGLGSSCGGCHDCARELFDSACAETHAQAHAAARQANPA
jgi:bacterioferritin-associated ferredoxin